MCKNRTFSCGNNAGNPQRSRVANQNALLMESQCYANSIHSLRLFTCRVRKQFKRLGFFFLVLDISHISVLFLCFHSLMINPLYFFVRYASAYCVS